MTVKLLQWCKSYSPKRDGRKLQFNNDGTIEGAEIVAFDAYLHAPWDDKNPGLEISREIARESRGLCGNCQRATDALEVAHIDRFEEELTYHCQHPHNLIMLCVECHTRYDRLRTLTNDQIKHAKQILIARLMEDVDRDFEMQRQMQTWVMTYGSKVMSAWQSFTQGLAQQAETVVTGSASAPAASPAEAGEKLSFLSGSVAQTSPLTSKLLNTYAVSVLNDEPPPANVSVEDLFDDRPPQPGKCYRDGEDTPIESASCSECGEGTDTPSFAVAIGDGSYELYDEDFRGDTTQIVCECGSKSFDVEFEALCEYCAHMSSKDD